MLSNEFKQEKNTRTDFACARCFVCMPGYNCSRISLDEDWVYVIVLGGKIITLI